MRLSHVLSAFRSIDHRAWRPVRGLAWLTALLVGTAVAGAVAAQPTTPKPVPSVDAAASSPSASASASATAAGSAPLAAPATDADLPGIEAQVDDPRPFGHLVGDVLQRRVVLDVPRRLQLIEASIPSPGRIGQSFELHRVVHERRPTLAGTRHTLTFTYQLFRAPREPVVLDLPAFTLRFDGQPRSDTLRVDFAPVGVSPLTPNEAVLRAGFGTMRPDVPPMLADTRPEQQRLMTYAVAALLPLGYLAVVYLGWPWWQRRQRPFAQAMRQLGTPNPTADSLQAWRHMHAAFDAAAGQVLHPGVLAQWLARQPRYAPLRDELVWFFARSQAMFFAGDAPSAADLSRLQTLCRRCRDAERGSA